MFPHDFYLQQQMRREQNQKRNQQILNKQVFTRSEQHGHIQINPDNTIEILDLDGAINDFSHQPQMLNSYISQGLHRRDKDLLERGLTQAYQSQLSMIY